MKEHLFPFNTKLLYEVRTIYIYVECNEVNYTRALQVHRGVPLHAYIFLTWRVHTGTFTLFSINIYIYIYIYIYIFIISIISRTYVE